MHDIKDRNGDDVIGVSNLSLFTIGGCVFAANFDFEDCGVIGLILGFTAYFLLAGFVIFFVSGICDKITEYAYQKHQNKTARNIVKYAWGLIVIFVVLSFRFYIRSR